ncbi:Fis family transcriptional regulator [Planctobacterium marinum]|uniref:Fis family transcriptional regulator n=1 Tax=Planctobacterium marinum TaxID=1631968 RepID=UPI001E3DCA9C|nr:Fis family transcriptional regulator [Planctobacterium marinum]MCC2603832.1 Fis family transcriptional regulator [Planctobacterium marinum]
MRKSDKKRDNQLRSELTEVCEAVLEDIAGFQWLTHLVNYSDFPNSLKVICVFDTNESLDNYLLSGKNDFIQSLIHSELQKLNINLKPLRNHILFDTEENCKQQHDGNWAKRLT